MKYFLFPSIVLFLWHGLFAQVVDKTRLEYDEELLQAKQVGMAVSHDQKHAAFLLNNGELRVIDLSSMRTLKSFHIDISEVSEIAFTQNDQSILVVERSRFTLYDWRNKKLKFSQNTLIFIRSLAVSQRSNHFALVINGEVQVWDAEDLTKVRNIKPNKVAYTASFNPNADEIIINPEYSTFKRSFYVYNFRSGKLINEHKKNYSAFYDQTDQFYFLWRNRAVGSAMSVPTFRHVSIHDPEDYKEIQIFGIVKGKNQFESTDDIGLHESVLRVGNHVIATRDYRGFSVFDIKNGGKVFTTQSTFKDRTAQYNRKERYVPAPMYRLGNNKALVNAYGDNINQIYSADQNAIIGYLFIDADGTLACISRDGRFDGNPDAGSKLFWASRKRATKTKLESTFSQEFSPGLLRALIHGDEIIQELDIDKRTSSLPVLALETFDGKKIGDSEDIPKVVTGSKTAKITVSIQENIFNVNQLKFYHNHKLVQIKDNPSANEEFEVSLSNTFGPENFIYVVASSKEGYDSEKKKLIVHYSGKVEAEPKLFILSVGVNEYQNPRYNLNYAIADANAFTELLGSNALGIFKSIEQVTIRDQEFTKARLMDAFEKIKLKANEQDLLVFYYAGHGVMSEGIDGPSQFYLIPHDITQLYGREDLLQERGVSADELKEVSRTINAQKQVFILDACQSAAALDAVASRGVSEERAIAQLARSTGTYWITAAGSEQFATEFESLGHGVFTYALLEGLNGKADGVNQDRKITVKELSAYLEFRVPELSEKFKEKPQYPAGYSFGNDFPLSVY